MRSKRLKSGDSGESSSTRKKPKRTRSKTGEGSKSSARDAAVVNDDVTMMNVVESKMEERNEGSSPSSTTRPVREATISECRFIGESVPAAEARKRWPERYGLTEKHTESDGEDVLYARLHYTQAEVDGCVYNLDDSAYIKGEDDEPDYIARIVEMFESTNHKLYFTAQWFFRAEDTVIKGHANLIDDKRVFISDIKTETPLDCIISKLNIVKVDLIAKAPQIPPCDFYYDMMYSMPYSTFANISTRNGDDCETSSTTSFEGVFSETNTCNKEWSRASTSQNPEMTLLDLYSGCGAMSTGLCFGATLSGVNLVTRWAVDVNRYACQSLKHNHPETQVRNETAENFFALLKEWEKLCSIFSLLGTRHSQLEDSNEANTEDDQIDNESSVPSGEFEVEKFIGICFGDPNKMEKVGLYFQVRWKGYGPSDDTWEPIDGLGKCDIKLKEFVTSGYKSNILPLPGDVDVICGGPPCQGISGFNRFRNAEAPLEDQKNHQLVVYMDIVNHLKPKYVLMENVVDILKFSGGYLGRYALGRLVAMNYQTRLGMMAAGCYGLPQFRMRAFLWGAHCDEKLPQYPLPTHEVVVRGIYPTEFEMNVVAYSEDETCVLENALLLSDAISDLPSVTNDESRDEMPYGNEAQTEFQQYIRLSKSELLGTNAAETNGLLDTLLHDHRPKQMNEDDYQRACHIPKEKGANFRNLPGVSIGPDNKVMWDERVDRVILPSGKPLVPDYAMSFVKGSSTKPFGRLWWDEIIATVVTRAEPHNQAVLHPEQDRVLTIRENARLQGFPDYYKLFGPVKERYIQVGNAVAVPVARALGYALGLASQGKCGDEPLFTLPPKFAHSVSFPLASIDDDANC